MDRTFRRAGQEFSGECGHARDAGIGIGIVKVISDFVIPSSRGGVAALAKQFREATEAARPGCSLTRHVSRMQSQICRVSDHPGRANKGCFAAFFLMSRLPLLTRRGILE